MKAASVGMAWQCDGGVCRAQSDLHHVDTHAPLVARNALLTRHMPALGKPNSNRHRGKACHKSCTLLTQRLSDAAPDITATYLVEARAAKAPTH